jgi:enamine deaminase RidA (YjgF/YER057c/UK114 family)
MHTEKLPGGGLRIQTGAPWESIVGYSRAIRKGPHIWVAGTTAMRDGQLVGDDAYTQARTCLEIIAEALAATGASMDDVVRTRLYVTDIADWEHIGRAHGEFFRDIRPVATMVEVAALIDPRMKVEIEVEAYQSPA